MVLAKTRLKALWTPVEFAAYVALIVVCLIVFWFTYLPVICFFLWFGLGYFYIFKNWAANFVVLGIICGTPCVGLSWRILPLSASKRKGIYSPIGRIILAWSLAVAGNAIAWWLVAPANLMGQAAVNVPGAYKFFLVVVIPYFLMCFAILIKAHYDAFRPCNPPRESFLRSLLISAGHAFPFLAVVQLLWFVLGGYI
ncbi:hypothetical protein [Singulisphaera sp. PoT]|uniref:hypothetical protein n=1 Tax=Singulisphaera sp. PoT TaxID=3411797 RepID=UPI003BF58031